MGEPCLMLTGMTLWATIREPRARGIQSHPTTT
jgi:hypothetical protein